MDEYDYIRRDQQQRHDREHALRVEILERDHGFRPADLFAVRAAAAKTSCEYANSDRFPFLRSSAVFSRDAMPPRAPGAVQLSAAAAQPNSSISSMSQLRASPYKKAP